MITASYRDHALVRGVKIGDNHKKDDKLGHGHAC